MTGFREACWAKLRELGAAGVFFGWIERFWNCLLLERVQTSQEGEGKRVIMGKQKEYERMVKRNRWEREGQRRR